MQQESTLFEFHLELLIMMNQLLRQHQEIK